MDRNDPAHVEAEAAFGAMVSEIVRAEIAEHIDKWEADQLTDGQHLAERMMLGTAEGYDGSAQDAQGPVTAGAT